ncbi:MAG TPA: DUF11 domain-containing protein, partial [Mycobacterium sp.]|nr:DUF11 domain-containing protein [Mycobacterium sp.]
MSTRANPIRALPIIVAFLMNVVIGPLAPVAQTALVNAANDGIDDYAQCMIGDGAGLDCAGPSETPDAWTNGILNDTHNDYAEDEVVPQRLQMTFEPNTSHTVTIRYMTRKDSSGQRHAYDYLATWNHTYVNADRCEDLPSGVACIGGAPDTLDIPSDPNSVTPVGSGISAVTADHELPQANRQFVMYGGTLDGATTPVHAVDPGETGSDYASITVSFTVGAGGQMQLLWGGHLASGFGPRGWGENLGAASISGGPYHMIVDAVDGASIGQRDNQIMSNAIDPLLPALGISKTADAATVNAGENIGFTITVTNTGEGLAENVTLSDPLPAGAGVNWDIIPAYAGPGTCSIAGNPPAETLSCSFGNLAAGASASVHVQSATTFDSCKEYPNTATAQATNFTPVEASASTSVLCPNLSIQKSTSTPTIYAGEFAYYTVTVSNSGSGTATGVFISDSLPSGLTWVEDPDKTECFISLAGLLSCTNITLGPSGAANSSFSVTIKGQSDAADCPSILNRATFGSGNDGSGQTHPEGQGVQVSILCPDVGVEKTAFASPINAGDEAKYTITVTSGGTGTSKDVTIHDDLPPVAGDWMAAIQSPDGDDSCAVVADDLNCSFGDMEPGQTKVVVLTYTTAAADCGTLLNDVSVFSDLDTDGDSDPEFPGNQVLDVPITVDCGDLVIVKSPDLPGDMGGTVNVGDVATFSIQITNQGLGTARGVTLEDYTLPETANGWNLGSSFD